jgi:acyl-CoA dehydrogenase
LGDILSYLYLLSSVLKNYYDEGENEESLPVVRYACLYCLFEIQERFDEILKNFPNRVLAWILKVIIFPLGQRFSKPRDNITHKVAQLLIAPTETRERLAAGAYLTAHEENPLADVQDALIKTIASEPIEKIIRAAKKEGNIEGFTAHELAQSALNNKIITVSQFDIFMQAEDARYKVLSVDDFSPQELQRVVEQIEVNTYEKRA